MVSNVSEFLGNDLNIWDNDSAVVYSMRRKTVASRWLYYGVSKLLWVFIKYQIMSYILNFVFEILLILTYDLGLAEQTMNDTPFYMVWVVGLEVQITTSMSRFPVHFHGQIWTPLHDQNIQEQKGIISFNFSCEFGGRSNAVEMAKKLLLSCWSIWPNHENVIHISEPF
jgi:hypothetical protein